MSNRATVMDVANEAGVSPATVSRVLNHRDQVSPDTAQRVMQAMERLNFTPPERAAARSARPEAGRSPMSAPSPLLVFNLSNMNNPFYGDLVRGAVAAANKHGYNMLVDSRPLNGINFDAFLNMLRHYNVAGVVTTEMLQNDLIESLEGYVSLVQCSEYNPEAATSYVSIDNYVASKRAAEYILSTGRRQIQFLSTPKRFLYALQRWEGYRAALDYAGVPYQDSWVTYVPEVDFQLAFRAAQKMLEQGPPPQAIFAVSDVLAAASIKAAHLAGISVPRDMMVVGFDNVDISLTCTPTITTVHQPRYQLGYSAAELLIEKTLDPSIGQQHILLDTELIIRESSALRQR